MNKTTWVVIGLLAIVILVVLGLLSGRVGGVSVRSASRTFEVGTLTADQTTLLPGVPVRFDVELVNIPRDSSLLVLRMPKRTYTLNEVPAGQLRTGALRVTLPCDGSLLDDGGTENVRLVLVENGTNAVLAQSSPLTVLPPGPDCLYN